MKKVCFHCGENIGSYDDLSYIGLDKPYINLPFHQECVSIMKTYGEQEYLEKNKKKVYSYIEDNPSTKRRK